VGVSIYRTDGVDWRRWTTLALASTTRGRSANSKRGSGPTPTAWTTWNLLPAAHRVASLAKRWLLGTHQGAVDDAHLPSYLNEFVFRFNRRQSRSRGMVFYRVLELAMGHAPVRYSDIVAGRRPRKVPPTPPLVRGKPQASTAHQRTAHGGASPVRWRPPLGQ
jgi:hypothetical protein